MKHVILYSLVCIASLNTPLSGQTKVTPKKTVSPSADVLTNQSIISLVKAGLDKTIIITTIKNAETNFDTSASAILSLKKSNVSNEIITAILNKKATVPELKKATPKLSIDILNTPYYIDKDGSYKQLEKNLGELKTKLKGMGYGGSETNYEINGETSSTVFKTGEEPSFVVNAGEGQSLVLALYKATVKKGKRLALFTSAKVFGKNNSSEYAIQFNTSVVKSGVFKIEFTKPLETGEYFFVGKSPNGLTYDVFSFSIQ